MSVVEKARTFTRETQVEVKKVSWPSRKELQESTLLVIVTVTLIMIFVGIIDRVFSALAGLIIG